MSRDVHVRFCEKLGGQFPGLTRLIIGFSDKSDAERVMKILPKRSAKYDLTLHPDKTRMLDLSSGSVGERGGNESLYPEYFKLKKFHIYLLTTFVGFLKMPFFTGQI